jgi:hypothetical protein
MERRNVVDYRYLTSIWAIRLFIRHCDICKILGLKFVSFIAVNQKRLLQPNCIEDTPFHQSAITTLVKRTVDESP